MTFPGSFGNLVGREPVLFERLNGFRPLSLVVGYNIQPVFPSKRFQRHLGAQQLRFIFGSLQSIQDSR